MPPLIAEYGYAGVGAFDIAALALFVFLLPFTVLGTRLGERIAGHIDQRMFGQLVGVLVLVCGGALFLK